MARQLLAEVDSGATIDRHASDQIIPFASLADGTSSFQVPFITGHTETAGWLASLFLRAEVRAAGNTLAVHGRDASTGTWGSHGEHDPADPGTQPPALGVTISGEYLLQQREPGGLGGLGFAAAVFSEPPCSAS